MACCPLPVMDNHCPRERFQGNRHEHSGYLLPKSSAGIWGIDPVFGEEMTETLAKAFASPPGRDRAPHVKRLAAAEFQTTKEETTIGTTEIAAAAVRMFQAPSGGGSHREELSL